MFKTMAADFAGTSDNCVVISKDKWTDAATIGDAFEFLRPGEKVFVYLKSKVYEWIFTDLGLLKIDRDNAAGVKRFFTRQEWINADINLDSLRFSTAGAGITDYSCEIDFIIQGRGRHIEIVKSETAYARKLFVCLTEIAVMQYRNRQILAQAVSLKAQILAPVDPTSLFNMLSVTSRELINTYDPVNYGHVFEKCMVL